MESKEWNTRYVNYALGIYNCGPDEALEMDNKNWPGGRMAGFIFWIRKQWYDFHLIKPTMNPDVKTEEDHKDFDLWLTNKYKK